MNNIDLKFNKKATLKMLNDLIKLVEKDNISELRYDCNNGWIPDPRSNIVMFGEVKPELTSQIFTLYVGYKNK